MSTWMVVEDEPDIYDVLLAMFEIWGIEGIAFVDGAEAVAWVEDVDKGTLTSDELPELAILDIRLPEISGPEVGARIRQSKRLGQIAIVLITAYRLSPEEEEQVKKRAQADDLMYKPLPPMIELRKKLDHIIGSRKKPSHKPADSGTTGAGVSHPALPVQPPINALVDPKKNEPRQPEPKQPDGKPQDKRANVERTDVGGGRHAKP